MLGSKRILACFGVFVLAFPALGAVNVTTWRYDPARTGQNLAEAQLVPTNVNSTSFGKLFAYAVDGYVYAQPLYISSASIAGKTHNVLIIATQHDSVYAFDADQNVQLWKASLIDTAHGAPGGATTVPSGDVGTNDILWEIGITGTPVIDAAAGTVYVVAKSKESGNYVQRLHALDLGTGSERVGSPVVIQGSVPGAGIGSVAGSIAFQSQWQLNRGGLLLFNNTVYIPFAAHGDNGPYHGWIFSYDASTLRQTAVFNTSSNGKGNGVWQSGAGLAADTVNGVPRMFFATGNFFGTGTGGPEPVPPLTNAQSYSNAIVRLNLSNGGLQVEDEWTPFDEAQLSRADTDQGSGGVVILPDQAGAHLHELIQVGKNGRIEVLDRDNLGGFNTYNNIAQEINNQIGGQWSTPAYWNGNVYFWGNQDRLKQFRLTNGQLSTTPTATGADSSGFPGSSPVVSSNGTSGGILWAIRSDGYTSNSPTVLYAFDANNVATLLYTSAQNVARDSAGRAVKFAVPVVANGKVYVGTQGEVDVYGLLAGVLPAAPTPTFSPAPGVYATNQFVTLSDGLSGAVIYYTTDGTLPSTASTRYAGAIAVSVTTTIKAIAAATGYSNSNVAVATYTIGTAPTINFSNGFASVAGMTLNGTAVNSNDSRLQLTTGASSQAGSAFWSTPVNVQKFVTDFTLQLSGTAPLADGITFAIAANTPTALGPYGGGLGYGPDQPTGPPGIPNSVAVKFDIYSNAGEGTNSTGLYSNGASPTTPSLDLTGTGVVLGSGSTIAAHLSYDGTMLSLTLNDPVNGGTYTHSFPIDIPRVIGSASAYVGFTGGTGGLTASQKILTWTFATAPLVAPVTFEAETLSGRSSGPVFRTFSWPGFPDGIGTILDATAVGDNVTFTANIARAGSYDLHVTAKNYNTRGIWQLSVDGVNVGTPHDEYSPTEAYSDFDVGSVIINSAGSHTFRFSVVGRNAKSTGSRLSIDSLKFNPL